MNRFNKILLVIASVQISLVRAFSLSFDVASTSSHTNVLKRQLTSPLTYREMSPPLAFIKRDDSSTQLLFSPSDSNEDKEEPWIRPAIHNSPLFRVFAILYALLFAIYQGSNAPTTTGATALQKIGKHIILAPKAAATLHLLSFGTWIGTVVYTTFIAGITMFKVRQCGDILANK